MNEVELYQRLVELAEKVSAIEDKVDFMLRELKLEYHPPATPELDEVQSRRPATGPHLERAIRAGPLGD